MLTISPINNIGYYANLATEDYYLDGGEPEGEWVGLGSRLFKELSGTVKNEHYQNIYHGVSPCGQYALRQFNSSSKAKQRAGWDLTFSAPKSVSVAWARADRKLRHKIQLAHKLAVLKSVSLIENNVAVTRTGKGGLVQEQPIGIVASCFEHSTSRAQDPQLHSHCLISNIAARENGTWGTLDSKHFYNWKMAIGAAYRAELAKNLQELGFTIESDGESFRLGEIPSDICNFYSKRTKDIKAELEKSGIKNSSSRAGDIATLLTRQKKDTISRVDLFNRWHKELDQLGYTESQFQQRLDMSSKNVLLDLDQTNNLTIESLGEQLINSKSSFTVQDIYKQAFVTAQITLDGITTVKLVVKEFINDFNTIELGFDSKGRQLYTTNATLELESMMINKAKGLTKQSSFEVSLQSINKAIKSNAFILSDEQQEAIYRSCEPSNLRTIQGSAGAGKSASMNAVRKIYNENGYKVIGAAIAKSAANNLADEANITTFTIAKLLKDESRLNLSNSVILIDEAGQVSTKDLLKLINLAKGNNCKLILVGEDKQLDAIEHAGSLRYLSQPEVIGTTRIESIRRQKNDWAKQIVADFRDGNSKNALFKLDNKGLLNICNNSENTKRTLVERWCQYNNNKPENDSIMLAQRWDDVIDLNNLARKELQQNGSLSTKEIELDCTVSNKIFSQKLAVGERIRLTQNDYKLGLTNGDIGKIQEIYSNQNGSYNINIELDSGKTINLSTEDYSDKNGNLYMIQAYAMTVYSSQGLTIAGDSFVYYTSGMDRSNTYVACSRHKDNSHLFINKTEINELISEKDKSIHKDQVFMHVLATKMASNERKVLATELASEIQTKSVEFRI
ncbi:MobF family relaxase [Paraglaciecola aquimarina]|uniref:MobF family relaxase n=1 Tax=Paraglaciecola aquimarina TaxID=1235557 RepID=A0ABU3SV13_9ALTE|nr:MobF family relaxase [Paraglaciecola aquimarina]MDU0353828.1 MobF family relaxase [Paraglaciecola aquimarina]